LVPSFLPLLIPSFLPSGLPSWPLVLKTESKKKQNAEKKTKKINLQNLTLKLAFITWKQN
jgi:hypothetical protein